jgi:hypothetical protein
MDATGPIAQRFPLIARPRPPCTALSARITSLAALADRASRDGDSTAASRVHNQAALIASDCGQPELARAWCHRHARAYLDGSPPDAAGARQALEPLVNLARLHIRAGDGDAAVALLDDLYQAVLNRTTTVIDGITVPAAALTSSPDSHRELSRWLWSVHLADGTRALTTAGRWHDAETQLQQHNGIGQRMLDGRQVAIIARTTRGEHAEALHLLAETEADEPWEAAVTACLTALARPADRPVPVAHLKAMINQYRRLQPDPTLAVFRTRLALSIIDAIGNANHPAAQSTARDLIRAVLGSRDGYAARDLLAHRACVSVGTAEQTRELATVLRDGGLSRPVPPSSLTVLKTAMATSEAVIMLGVEGRPRWVRGGGVRQRREFESRT